MVDKTSEVVLDTTTAIVTTEEITNGEVEMKQQGEEKDDNKKVELSTECISTKEEVEVEVEVEVENEKEEQIVILPSVTLVNQDVVLEEKVVTEEVEEVTIQSTSTRVSDIKQIEKDIVIVSEPGLEPEPEPEPEPESTSENKIESTKSKSQTQTKPNGDRWAISAPHIDLSGNWKIVVDEKFKEEYDLYLKNLGQPSLVRSIAVSIVEMTTEEVVQGDGGRSLLIKGRNLRGVWDRTLFASGSDYDSDFDVGSQDHDQIDLITADNEKVKAEAWWEENGTVHRSYLRGLKKYGGGDFESRRYLEDGGNIFICESVFHPKDGKEQALVTWKFQKI